MSKRRTGRMTKEHHASFGLEVERMRIYLIGMICNGGPLAQAYPMNHRAWRAAENVAKALDRLKCVMDSVAASEGHLDSPSLYYGRAAEAGATA